MHEALAIHEAYRRGDLEGLKALLGDPPDFPNCRGPAGIGEIVLEYAIYHGPLAFIRTLLEQGADPNYQDRAGFPALIAALSTDRPDRHEIVELLLAFGADIQQRGLNDWTPLHYAAATDDLAAIKLLLARAADPDPEGALGAWVRQFVDPGGVDTQDLLVRITRAIKTQFAYQARTIHGTQTPTETLELRSGTCRDFALLMIEAVRSLGMAARFVTGYLYDPSVDETGASGADAGLGGGTRLAGAGATHAWAQVYLPGAGWVEFDPTNGLVGGAHLIRVAVARDPRQAIALSGSYRGFASDFIEMLVNVRVTAGAPP